MRDAGLFGVFAGTRQENVERVLEITLQELEKVKQGMDRDQLDGAKHKTIGIFVLSTESTHSRMYQLGISTLRLGRPRTIREVIDGLEAVTPEEVARMDERIFDRDRVSVTALGLSKEKAEDLRTKLG
jgi:predicted Zn-dependent peptidase